MRKSYEQFCKTGIALHQISNKKAIKKGAAVSDAGLIKEGISLNSGTIDYA